MKQVEEAKDVIAKVKDNIHGRGMYSLLIRKPYHLVEDGIIVVVADAVELPCNDAVWYGVSNPISLLW